MVVLARDAFGEYWLADVTRFTLCAVSMVLVMMCVRFSWLRARSPKGDRRRDTSPWALLSYGLFAFIPTVLGFRNLGRPLDPLLTPIFMLALLSGGIALFGQISIRLLRRTDSTPEASDAADE